MHVTQVKKKKVSKHNKAGKQIKTKHGATKIRSYEISREKSFSKDHEAEFVSQRVWGHVVHCCSPSAGEYLSRHAKCHLCDATCLQCTGPEREDCTSCPATRWEPMTSVFKRCTSNTAEEVRCGSIQPAHILWKSEELKADVGLSMVAPESTWPKTQVVQIEPFQL